MTHPSFTSSSIKGWTSSGWSSADDQLEKCAFNKGTSSVGEEEDNGKQVDGEIAASNPVGTTLIKDGNKEVSLSCINFCNAWRTCKHIGWSSGKLQSTCIPWASKNSTNHWRKGTKSSSEKGGLGSCLPKDTTSLRSSLHLIIWDIQLRRNVQNTSEAFSGGVLQSACDGKPPPSWRANGGESISLIGNAASTPESDRSKLEWETTGAN